ncbi:hypothetical protein [Nibricoccus aquaticus]|uniref:hypothetical protein n=1 Tax=Nibricoccus aquaticus TaxID=2576891 RepID=UPI001FE9E096|nr:hypothetical protein [Nibricoccus aquaticus]
MNPRQLAGRFIYRAYHAPVGAVQKFFSAGGPFEQRRTEQGRTAMEAAAHHLPLLPTPSDSAPVTLHLLTGRRYWYQTAFCLWSFAHAAQRPLAPVLLDDGTLTPEFSDPILRLFPATTILTSAEIEARLDAALPEKNFPSLRQRRREFPLLRKLTDPHAGLIGWRLLIDSDLLFFRRPDALLAWLDHPTQPLRAEDLANAYGYPLALLAEVAGQPVPERVNTGLLGLRSDDINWSRFEYACHTLLARGGPQYYQEQALAAVLLAGRTCTVPPPADYVLCPKPPESHACRAVMHHYVADSKRWYFQTNWRRFTSPTK